MKEYEKQILAMIFDPRDETKEKIMDLFEKHTSIDYKIVSRELGIKKHIASKHLVQLTKRNIITKNNGKYELNGENISQALGIGLRTIALEYDSKGIALIAGFEGVL